MARYECAHANYCKNLPGGLLIKIIFKYMKYEKEFPLTKTRAEEVTEKFDLADPEERKKYFEAKVGGEITKLKKYFGEGNTFIVYLLGKKNAGKGTYTKLLSEIFGKDKIGHISVGDIVRDVHAAMEDKKEKKELLEYLHKNYRGFLSPEDGVNALLGRDQKTLLPDEFILALVRREIDKMPKKALFIDGLPRNMEQIAYSLFFKQLIDYRNDPDIFAAIDIPEAVIDERMKYRVVCPICHTPRNLKLLATKKVGYDEDKKEFYLLCDDPDCHGARMIAKEGDSMGIESIRERLEMDDKLIDKIFSTLHGVPKVYLRNAVPVDKAGEAVDSYEITPGYDYEYNPETKKVTTKELPYSVKDDEGTEVYSLLAPAVVVTFVKELVKALNL